MTVEYVQEGSSIDYIPSVDTPYGTVVIQGDLVGITKRNIKAGELGALALSGLFEFPKATGAATAIPVGTKLYWDAGAEVATADSGGGANERIGKTTADAGDDDETVRSRIP